MKKEIKYVGASFCCQCKTFRPKVEAFCKEKDIKFTYVDAEKSGFPEKELREKTSLHIDLDGEMGEVRMSRTFTCTGFVSPESRTALEKVFGDAKVEILPFKNDK